MLENEHEADVNAQDEAGPDRPNARRRSLPRVGCSTLLDGGADPSILDKRGRPALEPQLVSVGDSKCVTARGMIEDAARSMAARHRR